MFFEFHNSFVCFLSTIFTVGGAAILALIGLAMITCLLQMLEQHRQLKRQTENEKRACQNN
jgi:hypothetical protein